MYDLKLGRRTSSLVSAGHGAVVLRWRYFTCFELAVTP